MPRPLQARTGETNSEPVSGNGSAPPPKPSGISLRSPVLLVVCFDEEVARACRETASSHDVAFVRVAQGIAACRKVLDSRPTVVALGPTIWRDEAKAIADAATMVGARVIELPPFAPKDFVAYMLVRATLTR